MVCYLSFRQQCSNNSLWYYKNMVLWISSYVRFFSKILVKIFFDFVSTWNDWSQLGFRAVSLKHLDGKYVRYKALSTYGTATFKGTYRTGSVKCEFLGKMSTFSKWVQYLQFSCNRYWRYHVNCGIIIGLQPSVLLTWPPSVTWRGTNAAIPS
jgi:hypothetical protein